MNCSRVKENNFEIISPKKKININSIYSPYLDVPNHQKMSVIALCHPHPVSIKIPELNWLFLSHYAPPIQKHFSTSPVFSHNIEFFKEFRPTVPEDCSAFWIFLILYENFPALTQWGEILYLQPHCVRRYRMLWCEAVPATGIFHYKGSFPLVISK